MTEVASREGTGLPEERVRAASVLSATAIEKAYRRGMWPARRSRPVLRGADLVLWPVRWSGWSARTARARAPS